MIVGRHLRRRRRGRHVRHSQSGKGKQEAMHPWDVGTEEALAIQRRLRPLVRQESSLALDDIRTVAGIDVSYGEVGRAAVVVLSFPALEVLEEVAIEGAARLPYVPGLLSLRGGA